MKTRLATPLLLIALLAACGGSSPGATYNLNVGTIGDFIGHQGAISGAMGEAGC
jgi:hypothetical protein